jgi:hypothetical protein
MVGFLVIGLFLIIAAFAVGYFASGWKNLEKEFPDQEAPALRTFSFRSAIVSDGWKFGFSFGGLVSFQVCEGGLRVGFIPPFSFVCGSFFVPWGDVVFAAVPPLLPQARIVFGKPMVGAAMVSTRLAQQIALSREKLLSPAP